MEVLECVECHGSLPLDGRYEVGGRLLCRSCAQTKLGPHQQDRLEFCRADPASVLGIDARRHYGGIRALAILLSVAALACLFAAGVFCEREAAAGRALEWRRLIASLPRGDPTEGADLAQILIAILALGCLGSAAIAACLVLFRRILICLEAGLGVGKRPKYGPF